VETALEKQKCVSLRVRDSIAYTRLNDVDHRTYGRQWIYQLSEDYCRLSADREIPQILTRINHIGIWTELCLKGYSGIK
jgi:hypothetical protein